MRRLFFGCNFLGAIACIAFNVGCGGHASSQLQTALDSSTAPQSNITYAGGDITQHGAVPAANSAPDGPAASQTGSNPDSSGTLTQHHAYLSWTPSPSHVLGYNIYRGPTPTGPFKRVNSGLEPATVFTDSTVAAGKLYYYVVTAVDAYTESRYSMAIAAKIPYP